METESSSCLAFCLLVMYLFKYVMIINIIYKQIFMVFKSWRSTLTKTLTCFIENQIFRWLHVRSHRFNTFIENTWWVPDHDKDLLSILCNSTSNSCHVVPYHLDKHHGHEICRAVKNMSVKIILFNCTIPAKLKKKESRSS